MIETVKQIRLILISFPEKGKSFLGKISVSTTYFIYMKSINQQHSQNMIINTRCRADELLKVKDGSSQRISYVQHYMGNPLKAAAQ